MNPHIPALNELQSAIRNNLLHSTDENVYAYIIADGLPAGERLNIYRNTATGVLVRALRLSFPAVQNLVGQEFFEGAARLFVAETHPSSALLDEYGADFPEFLARLPQAASLPYLPDVARLEWLINIVLHTEDAPPLDVACLARLNEAELGQLQFAPHPAAKLLRCQFPASAIWRAVLERDDSAMALIDIIDGAVWLLIQRTGNGIDVVELREDQWRFTAALFSQRPLHAALAEAKCTDAHALLAAYLARGCLTSLAPADQLWNP